MTGTRTISGTLGPVINERARAAGHWRTWGADHRVDTGGIIAAPGRELVRASIGYPVFWLLQVFFDGGVGPLGDLDALVSTGLGQVAGIVPFKLFGFGIVAQVPATELIISVQNLVPALAPYRVIAQAAPVSTWDPHRIPDPSR